MATAIELDATIVVRTMSSGGVYAHPVHEPTLASRTTSVEQALAQQERFLTQYLERAPAAVLSRFTLPRDATLLEVPVVLPRADLPRRNAITEPVTVPCVVVPHDGASWVHILPLETVAYFADEQDLERAVSEAAHEAARARQLCAAEFLARLPAQQHALHRIALMIIRDDADDVGSRAAARRKRTQSHRRAASQTLLDEVGTSLRTLHAKGRRPNVLGRDAEIEALAGLLGGTERLSVVLVGPELSGKSALVHGLVARSEHRSQTDPLGGRLVISTSGAQLVAGQSGFGELELRIASVMRAAEELDAIIYFDDLGDLLSGRPGTIEDMVSGMLPYVSQDRVRLVGELTPEQVSHYEKMHVGFMASLSRVSVESLDKDATRPILQARARHAAQHERHRPALSADAIGPLLDLCDRYLAYSAFPGKAVRLHDELRAVHESEVTEGGAPKPIGPAEVYRAFSQRSGIPLFLLENDRVVKLDQIERFFAQRVIGQRDAVRRVAQTVCMVKANLQPPGKPLANFLFIGPTGVGKTEVAKTLAQFLFGSGERMVRFDMSEYMDPMAAERLIRGTQREEGELTKRVRQQPFCVVLLDEIEKAHGAVFDLLLQVCGEGRLSDARGRTTWFNNAIIIMTSNLGAAHRRPDAGFGSSDAADPSVMAAYYLEQVDEHFRPEFVGRIDRVIPFSALRRDEVSAVAQVALRKITDRDGLVGRACTLEVSQTALGGLAEAGYSAAYGARALRRHLESTLVGPVSAVLAEHAAALDGARVDVRANTEEAATLQESFATEVRVERGGLDIVIHRPTGTQRRQGVHDLGVIATLRRTADRCLHSPLVAAIRERLDYVVADLAGGGREASPGQAGALAAEQGRLQGMLDEASDPVCEIADAEELAMTAVLEGAQARLLVSEAQDAFARFERGFVRLVASFAGGDAITFFADGNAREVFHLLGILEAAAPQRGWSVTVHRTHDPEPEVGWPPGGRYGPPRDLAWCMKRRDDLNSKAHVPWRRVLIRVRGPLATDLLEHELGLWHVVRGDVVAPLRLLAVGERYELSVAQLCPDQPPEDDPYAVPAAQRSAELVKLPPHRRWAREGERWSLAVRQPPANFDFEDLADFAASLERVQFGARAMAAHAEED